MNRTLTDDVAKVKRPSTLRLAWDYSISYRRLAIEFISYIAIATLWFAFVGYKLRKISTPGFSYVPLTKCIHSSCATTLAMPHSYFYISPITTLLLLAIPFMGAFIFIGPSLAGELESRAIRTLWTQAATRKQWLASRIIPAFSFTILTSTAVIIEANRWFLPHAFHGESYRWNQFVFLGVTFIGLAICSTAAIIGFSILFRRIPLVTVATAIFMAIVISTINATYPTLIPPKTAITNPGQYSYPVNSLLVGTTTQFSNGHKASASYVEHALSSCNHKAVEAASGSTANAGSQSLALPSLSNDPPQFNETAFNDCVKSTGLITVVSYQPASQYWPLQFIYMAILVALACIWVMIALFRVAKVEP